MRRRGPIRVFLSLLLAAWLPWCLCDRIAMGCCERAAPEIAPNIEVAVTCGGSCCASHQAPVEENPMSDDPCRPFGQCAAGCCVTKGLVSACAPEVPVDSIGAPLPATVVAVVPEAGFSLAEPAVLDDDRSAGPRAGPGRADSARRLLIAICVQTT
jgi:hypothetical protein